MSHESYKLSGHLCSADDFLGRKPRRSFTALNPDGWLLRDSVTTTTDENTVTQQFYTTSYKRAHLLGAIFVRGVDGKSLMGDPLCVADRRFVYANNTRNMCLRMIALQYCKDLNLLRTPELWTALYWLHSFCQEHLVTILSRLTCLQALACRVGLSNWNRHLNGVCKTPKSFTGAC